MLSTWERTNNSLWRHHSDDQEVHRGSGSLLCLGTNTDIFVLGKMACRRHEQLADLKGKGKLIQSGLFLPSEAEIGTVILGGERSI
jgi:hypothetical protein